MKSSASGTAKGDVIAEGGNKEALFIRGMRVIVTFSNEKSSCINKILLSNILREIQVVYIQLYAVKSDRMSQNFNSTLVHTSWRMLLGKAVSRTDMFPSDSWPKMIGEHQIYRLSRIGTLRNAVTFQEWRENIELNVVLRRLSGAQVKQTKMFFLPF